MGKVKITFYLETTAAIGIKVGLSIKINEFLKLKEYHRSWSLFDLFSKDHSDFKIKTCILGKLLSHLEPNSV